MAAPEAGPNLAKLRIDRSGGSRRRRRGGGWGGLIALALLAGLVWLFRGPILRFADDLNLPEVKVLQVELSNPAEVGAVQGLAANGYIVAARRAALSADTPGRIVEIRVEEGSKVAEGELVARLYDEELKAAVKRAEADLASARAGELQAQASALAARADVEQLQASAAAAEEARRVDEAEIALAKRELERAEELVKAGATVRSELDRARSAFDSLQARSRRSGALITAAQQAVASGRGRVEVADAEVKVAQARIAVAAAALEQARATLQKTEVRAPFAGIVVLKDAELGEVVSPNVQSGSASRGSVVTMVDFASLEVQADVPETSLAGIRLGGEAQVFLDAYSSVPYSGKVDRIWPTADRQKATIEVRVRFDAPDERLRPEMGVRVVFLPEDGAAAPKAEASEPVLLAPLSAVLRRDGAAGVFVLEQDVARFRGLELGASRGSRVAVTKGLSAGERIILEPPPQLRDGDRVRLEESGS